MDIKKDIDSFKGATNNMLDLCRSYIMDEDIKEDINNSKQALLISMIYNVITYQLSPNVVKSKLNKACNIQNDFYDREYRKCMYRYGQQ